MRDMKIGELHFRVTYPDANQRFPGIETLVYVGKNLSDEDLEDAWYFQPASNYVRHGQAGTSNTGDQVAIIAHGHDVHEMLSAEELFEEIRAALKR